MPPGLFADLAVTSDGRRRDVESDNEDHNEDFGCDAPRARNAGDDIAPPRGLRNFRRRETGRSGGLTWDNDESMAADEAAGGASWATHPADLDSPRRELSVRGLGFVVCSPFGFFQEINVRVRLLGVQSSCR